MVFGVLGLRLCTVADDKAKQQYYGFAYYR